MNWINVNEKLPELKIDNDWHYTSKLCIVLCTNGNITIAEYKKITTAKGDAYMWWEPNADFFIYNVQYWIPIPDRPSKYKKP